MMSMVTSVNVLESEPLHVGVVGFTRRGNPPHKKQKRLVKGA